MKTLLHIFLVGALVFMAGCTTIVRNNYILLIDNSKSIEPELMLKYISIVENHILPNLGGKDRLTVMFIDECSMTLSERVFHIDLAKMDFSRSTDGLNNELDSVSARRSHFLTDSVKTLFRQAVITKRELRSHCGNFTDIVRTLNESLSLLIHDRNYRNAWDKAKNDAEGIENFEYQNNLVIFSDGVNENREKTLDFTQFGKLDKEQVFKKLEDLRSENKIPDLSRCNVFMYGATSTSDAGPYANNQIQNVRKFWELFFNDAGATLKAYGYDTQNEIEEYVMAPAKSN